MTESLFNPCQPLAMGHFPAQISAMEQRAFLKTYNEYSREFVIWRDSHGHKKFVSSSCLHLTGYAADDFIADSSLLEQRIHPDDRLSWQQKHQQRRQHPPIQFRFIKRNGDIVWFEHQCTPLVDSAGNGDENSTSYIGNFVDITASKKAQDLTQKLAQAIDQNRYGIAITDSQGVIEYLNPAFIAMQPPPGLNIGDTLPLLNPESERGQQVIATTAGGQFWHQDIMQDSGQWQALSVSAIRDDCGQFSHYLVAQVDISRRIEDKERVLDQHRKLQALFTLVETGKREWEWSLDCINDVVVLSDRTGHVQRVNKAIGPLFNLEVQQIIGQPWRRLLPAELANQQELASEGEFYDPARHKWLQYRIFPFAENAPSSHIGQVITFHDATAMWQMNNDLSAAYEHLKSTQGQMVHQEKMASIGQLAAGVAHEINNPTGFVTSNLVSLGKYTTRLIEHIDFLEQIVSTQADSATLAALQQRQNKLKLSFIKADIADLIKESLEGTERIKSIVQNLKSFSRVDDTSMAVTNLHECLDAALNIVWNEIKYNATITKDYQPIPDIYCSAQQLNQVFLNLLINAAHALDQQGVIHIATATVEPWLVIKISDTGCGIPQKIISRIFEPFFTTKDVGKGTGLGLSICYDIIHSHHGEISVDSKEQQGTTFTIKLPIITEKPKESKGEPPTAN